MKSMRGCWSLPKYLPNHELNFITENFWKLHKYCIVSYYQHFFIKITLWEICQHHCVQILQFQFKADHNVAELKLHKRTVSIVFIKVSMLYITYMLLKRLTLLNILTKLRDHEYYILYMHVHRDIASLLTTLTIISLEAQLLGVSMTQTF